MRCFKHAVRFAACFAMSASGLAFAQNEDLERYRYKLEPGQFFAYNDVSEFEGDRGRGGTVGSWNVWVVDRNDDGSWRLAIFLAYSLTSNGNMREDIAPYFCSTVVDVFPDGRRADLRTVEDNLDRAFILPLFPADSSELRNGWTWHEHADETHHSFSIAKPELSDNLAYAVQDNISFAVDLIYATERTLRFEIGEFGMPTRVTEHYARNRALPGAGQRTIVLTKHERVEESVRKRLRACFKTLVGSYSR